MAPELVIFEVRKTYHHSHFKHSNREHCYEAGSSLCCMLNPRTANYVRREELAIEDRSELHTIKAANNQQVTKP